MITGINLHVRLTADEAVAAGTLVLEVDDHGKALGIAQPTATALDCCGLPRRPAEVLLDRESPAEDLALKHLARDYVEGDLDRITGLDVTGAVLAEVGLEPDIGKGKS